MSRAAIIGGGVIGGGWAARFLLNGWDVAIYDPDPEAARKINDVLAGARRALPMLYDRALPAEGELTFCETLEDAVTGAIWIQESVPERLALKQSILKSLQDTVSERAVIGSSTSGFKPTDLQEGAMRPGQIIVTHPFNPVYLIPLVEVIGSAANDDAFLTAAEATLTQLGMFPQMTVFAVHWDQKLRLQDVVHLLKVRPVRMARHVVAARAVVHDVHTHFRKVVDDADHPALIPRNGLGGKEEHVALFQT